MAWKIAGLAAAGVAAGAIASRLVPGGTTPVTLVAPVRVVKVQSVQPVAATPGLPLIDPRIALLKKEIEDLRAADLERIQKSSRTNVQQALERMMHADRDMLVAAGFPLERADWFKSHADELLSERMRKAEEARSRGLDVDRKLEFAALEASADKDILLFPELGEAEFERYRVAVGRPIGVEVERVPAGSNAERAGIKPGDQVISYGGKRVISIVALNMFALENPPAESVLVEVRRNGKTIRLSAPSGPVYIKAGYTSPTL